jgi:transcription factor TGA
VLRHVNPLAEQQQAAVCDVQQSARRVEEALDGELETLLRSLSEVVSSDDLHPPAMYGQQVYHPAADVAGYMGQMHMVVAMDKLAALGNFLRQASDCFSSFILGAQVHLILTSDMHA